MSGSGMDENSAANSRYDCFISFHGSQKLVDLGFTWAGPDDTVRDLAMGVYDRLRASGRNPSVFCDLGELKGDPYRDDLSKAVLQLRGGGVALILLTAEYLRRKWCIAELHAFFELHKLESRAGRADEAVVLRVVCLDSVGEIKSALREHTDGLFVGGPEGVGKFQWQSLGQVPSESSRALVLKQICGHVLDYWSKYQSLCLGKNQRVCLMYMQRFFATTPLSLISSALGVTAPEAIPRSISTMLLSLVPGVFSGSIQDGLTREYAFSQALQQGSLSDENLSALSQVITDMGAITALRAFRRKWISDGWSWSIDSDENDICLTRFIEEAAGVLRVEKGANGTGATSSVSASAGAIPTVDRTAALPNGDVFRPYLPNRQHFSKGLEAIAATGLARLKAAVLPVGLELRRVALTSINGEGGVGKTSTCKLLCTDAEVQKYFAFGGILWIDVGRGATENEVKKEIRSAVSLCGGHQTCKDITSSVNVSEAVKIASSFFSGHRILVVLDNVWETPDGFGVDGWASTLAEIATSPGSAVIVTTRFISVSRLSPGFDSVDLGRYDLTTEGSQGWRAAEDLYDSLLRATLEERSDDAYKKDRREVLEISCGLPIVISTFVGLVRRTLGGNVGNVLTRIRKSVNVLVGESVGGKVKTMTGHPGLHAVMKECLAHLDDHAGFDTQLSSLNLPRENDSRLFRARYCDESGKRFSSRYAALEVMSKSSTRLSFPVLRHVWHVEEADEIAELFQDIGLGRISSNGQDGVFTLHDLQYEYCVSMPCNAVRGGASRAATDVCVPMPVAASGHALFLSSCESLLLSSSTAGDDVGQRWAQFCFAEGRGLSEEPLRQYLTRNLFRHLSCAAEEVGDDGVKRTMMSVLSDFGWLRGQFVEDGGSSAILDCTTALASRSCSSAGSSAETRLLTGGTEKSIRALLHCLLLVGVVVSAESDGTLAGSLVQLSQSSVGKGEDGMDTAFFTKLARSSESRVCGPYVKPITGCFRTRDQGVLVQAVVGSGCFVRSLAALGDGVHFVSGGADGVVRVHESEYLSAVLELSGHTDAVNCVAVGKKGGVEDTFVLFSCSDDGKVCSWEVGVDHVKDFVEQESIVVGDCGSRVLCLAVSNGGGLVAAGCESGTVFIWKHRDGDAALSFISVTRFCCTVGENVSDWVSTHVRGLAVARSGDFVVAGEEKGGIGFWSSSGSGSEGTVARFCAADESDAGLSHVLLSEDESSAIFVFDKPAGCEVWDVAPRRKRRLRQRSTRVALPNFRRLACATFSGGEDNCINGSGAFGVLVAGGWNESLRHFISLRSPSNDLEVLATYPLTSPPRSVCCTSFGGGRRILVGCDDGCVRMLDEGVPVPSHEAESYEEGALLLGSDSSDATDAPELKEVSAVAVMPASGFVVAGHQDGLFSLWRAESGEFVRSFENERGDRVTCVEFSANESLAVSGHWNGVALVWDASIWQCRFALGGHSKAVVCETISADGKRIVTVDWDGEIRVWDAEIGGAALSIIETGLEFSSFGSRGSVSLDGGLFLWASRDAERMWEGNFVDLRNGHVVLHSASCHVNWDVFLEELISSGAFNGEEAVSSRFGTFFGNHSVELPDVGSGQKYSDVWRLSSGEERDNFLPRTDCTLRFAGGGATSALASLSFDTNVLSIAAGWISSEVGSPRRAVVACQLRERSRPAIMHVYLASQ